MDPADTFLGRLLMDEITPVVMVLSTPLAEEACRKSGLDVVRLFAPFCVFDNIDVPVRTATDQPYRLQTFRLRMVYASEIRPWDPEVANKHLEDVVNKASENVRNDFQNDLPALQKMLTMAESEVVPSWLYSFNRDFSRALSFSDHEAFDHPVACLLVVSSEDEEPMNRFVDLFNTNQLPVHLSDNAMDPKIPKHYLLLHDGHVGTTEKALSVLSEMRGTFGLSDCRLLCINSLKGVAEEWRENPWVDYKNSSSSEDNACCLSIDDFNEIKTFMHDLSSKKIIPHLETKIRTLNQQVSATRKGFRNQIRNLWWRKGKEDAPETPDGPMYTFSSIESQIRILGDYAFMLRDYELALSNYRLLSTDYKLDKAWKRYAGVQEMVGLSLFMLDQSRKDSEYSMENAFNVYLRLGSLGLRNAARCGLWWAEMLKARGQYKEAAVVYFRMASEEPSLHAAVFLEQAAYCYLFSSPPMLRKFGFHLVLAGNRYYNADQRRHAIRTYRCALSVYKKNDWSYISDHVHYNIGRWYAYLGMFDAAILHMLEVLECTHQSLTTQDLFLKDFLHIVQNTGRKLEVPKLQLPSINMSSIRVIFEDYRTYASPAAVHVKESTWQALEENLIPSPVTNKSNWLDNRKIHLPKKYDSSVSVVGEAINVQLELKNPLQVSISVANLSLVCEYRSSHAAEESDDSLSMDGIQNSIVDPNISPPSDTNDHNLTFELSEINFLLGGGQTRDVQLSVIPKMEGFLKILGVKWTLSGSVMGYQSFDLDGKRKSRKGRGSVQSFRNMAFIVIKGLPKLKGFIKHLPQKAYKGDLRLLMLELKNDSEYSVKNLKMKFGQPRFLIPGSSEDINTEFPGCLQKQSSSLRKNASEDALDKSGSLLFVFPSDSRISAGTAFRWPLWLHAALSGELSLCMSIYYEEDNLTCDMNYRTLRIHHELEVSPSIDVSISITPCPNRLQEFLVQMEVASKTNSESFWLHQLSSVGCGWKILPLSLTDSVCSSQLLLAGQKLLCFFKLKGSGKSSLGEDEQNCEQSDLRLGPQDDNDLLFDISRTPLADFHKQEKFQHGKALQENPGMADFVLFSRLVEDVAGPDEADCIRLLSHHVCHRSVTSKSPIQWLIIGPQTVIHDFSVPFFEVDFRCRIQNCSEVVASVKIITFDTFATAFGHSRDSPPLSDSSTSGWHEISFDAKPTLSDVSVSRHVRSSPESVTPFVWCASSSTKVELQPVSVAEVPLRICVFSPGIYDLSNYEMHYSLQFSDAEGLGKDIGWQSSGMNRGHPYYLSVLESMP